jgi:hypothetical protein
MSEEVKELLPQMLAPSPNNRISMEELAFKILQ